jgi:hypothetical protein
MADQEHPLKFPIIRLWRYLPILIILGLAVHLLVPQITTPAKSWSVVNGMTWWAVTLAIVAQSLSYLGSGFVLHAILDTNQQKLSLPKGTLITMASANKVERQVGKSAAALLLESRIGERFDTIVTGASPKGTWVRLLKLPVEGKLRQGIEGMDVGHQLHVQLTFVEVDRDFIDFKRVG